MKGHNSGKLAVLHVWILDFYFPSDLGSDLGLLTREQVLESKTMT